MVLFLMVGRLVAGPRPVAPTYKKSPATAMALAAPEPGKSYVARSVGAAGVEMSYALISAVEALVSTYKTCPLMARAYPTPPMFTCPAYVGDVRCGRFTIIRPGSVAFVVVKKALLPVTATSLNAGSLAE
jgi:hypothetical protein